MTDLSSLSQSIASLIAEASKSIVRVDARRRASNSGVVFKDGVIITANHAIERDEHIQVARPDGTEVEASLAGRDPSTDLAVLQVSTAGLAPARWGDAATLALGHLVFAVARPGEVSATMGIASALDEPWRTHGGGRIDRWIESDLDLPRGFSGGALIDATGAAIGVNTSGLVRGRSLTIPASTVRRVVDTILQRGGVQRGFLGIGSHPIRLPDPLAKETGQSSALIVVSVQPGGPSEKAGIMIGDVLVSLDGSRTADVGELVGLLDEDRIGKEVTLRIVRAGELRDVKVTVGARSCS